MFVRCLCLNCVVVSSVVLTTFIPLLLCSLPCLHPDPTHVASAFMFFFTPLCLTPSVSHYHLFYISCLPPAPLPSPPPPPLSPSPHEGLGRASLIGSAWWWRQSDLEWVTDEVRSACCLSSAAAAADTTFIYIVQLVEPIHSYYY